MTPRPMPDVRIPTTRDLIVATAPLFIIDGSAPRRFDELSRDEQARIVVSESAGRLRKVPALEAAP